MKLLAITTALLFLSTSQLFSEVAPLPVNELTGGCDLIVVARVQSIQPAGGDKRYAKAKVSEVWKGAQTNIIEFLASPTWACDISEAQEGETVVLFLTRTGESRSYQIAYAGRGRMPVRTVQGKAYATFWVDVILPEATPTIDGPDRKWDFIRSVEVSTLRDIVKRAVQKKDK